MRRAAVLIVVAVSVFLACGATRALAQAEYRGGDPTTPSTAEACARLGLAQERTASTPPGFDARLPAPRGATSFTGVGLPGRGVTVVTPAPPGVTAPTDQAYQDCLRRR